MLKKKTHTKSFLEDGILQTNYKVHNGQVEPGLNMTSQSIKYTLDSLGGGGVGWKLSLKTIQWGKWMKLVKGTNFQL